MARFAACIVAALVAPALAVEMHGNSSAPPVTEKVTIDGTIVYSSSGGSTGCHQFATDAVNDPARPVIEVCGTGTKVTVFLRNRCEGYYEYSHEIASRGGGSGTSTPCTTASPATVSWMSTAQSYMIESCGR